LSFYEGVGVGVLKIEESESEVLCTDCTALVTSQKDCVLYKLVHQENEMGKGHVWKR
jgi:hypothetical protein